MIAASSRSGPTPGRVCRRSLPHACRYGPGLRRLADIGGDLAPAPCPRSEVQVYISCERAGRASREPAVPGSDGGFTRYLRLVYRVGRSAILERVPVRVVLQEEHPLRLGIEGVQV